MAGGRLTAAKNFDLIVKTFNKLGLPLKIYGAGPLQISLKNIAKGNIEFLGKVTDDEMTKLYNGAKAFILAQKDEDFGMTAVEAMGSGSTVIAFKGGGYLESVIDGKTGIFFDELSTESLSAAIKKFGKMKFKPENCVSQSKKFSSARFVKEMLQFVNTHAQKEV